jgi:hypothetical protein
MPLPSAYNKTLAIVCAALSIGSGYYAVNTPWAERIDFDIIGLLWLVNNIPQLLMWGLTLAFLFGAVVFGLRAWWDV